MRLKKNKAVYALPRGVTPSSVVLKVGKVDYPLMAVDSRMGFEALAKARKLKYNSYPYAWCWEYDRGLAIFPPPARAWKIEVRAMKEVVL